MALSLDGNELEPLPCPAWVWSSNAHVSIAKDRCWFGSDYTPFETFVQNMGDAGLKVVGIGTVDLPVKTGRRSHGILRLRNVLHAPGVICNVVGMSLDRERAICLTQTTLMSGLITEQSDGRPVAYFKARTKRRGIPLFEIRLSLPPFGPKVGPSPFKRSVVYLIHAYWPDSERERFNDFQTLMDNDANRLTMVEREWAKARFGGEFGFLQALGFSIYEKEDREDGRAILRAWMAIDAEE